MKKWESKSKKDNHFWAFYYFCKRKGDKLKLIKNNTNYTLINYSVGMKIIVAGSRSFNEYNTLKSKLDHFLSKINHPVIVSGTANGADKLGEKYAKEKDFKIKRFPANWDKHGKRAGYLRNEEMAKYADGCVVFWDGESKGTKHMIDIAKREVLQLRVVHYRNQT